MPTLGRGDPGVAARHEDAFAHDIVEHVEAFQIVFAGLGSPRAAVDHILKIDPFALVHTPSFPDMAALSPGQRSTGFRAARP